MARWVSISIKEPDFMSNEPRASAYLNNSNDIIIFGGNKKQQPTYFLNIQHLTNVNTTQGWAQKSLTQFTLSK